MPKSAALVLTSVLNGPSNFFTIMLVSEKTGFCEPSESCVNYLRGFENWKHGISASYKGASS